MITKKFGELKAYDKIYILMPLMQDIKEVTVTGIAVLKKNTNYYQISFMKPVVKPHIITDAKLLHANKMMGTDVTEKVLVPVKSSMVLLQTIPPTMLATSKEEIAQWMKGN